MHYDSGFFLSSVFIITFPLDAASTKLAVAVVSASTTTMIVTMALTSMGLVAISNHDNEGVLLAASLCHKGNSLNPRFFFSIMPIMPWILRLLFSFRVESDQFHYAHVSYSVYFLLGSHVAVMFSKGGSNIGI